MTGESLGPRALACETGVSTDTLRHYERKGLLGRIPRTTGGYRRYPPACVARVQLIQRALAIGFTLGELASVLGHRDRGGAPCRGVRTLVAERLGELETRLTALSALREDLRRLLAEWDERLAQTPPGRQARLLDMLAARPTLDGVAAAARSGPRPRTGRC
jgi:DNA-binding transcriptional MerR regulator